MPPPPIEGATAPDIPAALRRATPPALPEVAEPDVLRHYLHRSQETMGMIGISLFGTCTMKYNPRVNERLTSLTQLADMFMLHKTFGVPKGGGGPAVGAYGCSEELAAFLPGPLVDLVDGVYVRRENPGGVGRIREFLGNLQQVVKAYSWVLAMGGDGILEAADLCVLADNYMETRLLAIPGVTKAYPHLTAHRLEMTRRARRAGGDQLVRVEDRPVGVAHLGLVFGGSLAR